MPDFFPRGLDFRSEEFRRKLNEIARLAKRLENLSAGSGVTGIASPMGLLIGMTPPPDPFIWIQIGAATPIVGAHNRWSYAWTEKIINKLGAFQDKPAGMTSASTSWKAYNSIESNNAETGTQGNSIAVEDLPEGSTIQPVKGSPVVLARIEKNCDGNFELYFSYENAVNPVCEEEIEE